MDTRHRWALALAVIGGGLVYTLCVVGLCRVAGWRLELAMAVGLTAALVVEASAFIWRMNRPARGGPRACTGEEGLVGERCTAVTELAPEGSVRAHGEIWRGRTATGEPVGPGTALQVVAVDGLHVVVVRDPDGSRE